jgi:hypothetical protein
MKYSIVCNFSQGFFPELFFFFNSLAPYFLLIADFIVLWGEVLRRSNVSDRIHYPKA